VDISAVRNTGHGRFLLPYVGSIRRSTRMIHEDAAVGEPAFHAESGIPLAGSGDRGYLAPPHPRSDNADVHALSTGWLLGSNSHEDITELVWFLEMWGMG
jgi:hypothetical protein